MRSEGMAKEMPAATLSVLMPMTSPSWAGRSERQSLREPKQPLPSTAEHHVWDPRADLAGSVPA